MEKDASCKTYSATTLSSSDYPALIETGKSVPTVAVANALIGYNWPRDHRRGKAMARFAKKLVSQYDQLKDDPYHESWKEIDLSLKVPGLERHWSVEDAFGTP